MTTKINAHAHATHVIGLWTDSSSIFYVIQRTQRARVDFLIFATEHQIVQNCFTLCIVSIFLYLAQIVHPSYLVTPNHVFGDGYLKVLCFLVSLLHLAHRTVSFFFGDSTLLFLTRFVRNGRLDRGKQEWAHGKWTGRKWDGGITKWTGMKWKDLHEHITASQHTTQTQTRKYHFLPSIVYKVSTNMLLFLLLLF